MSEKSMYCENPLCRSNTAVEENGPSSSLGDLLYSAAVLKECIDRTDRLLETLINLISSMSTREDDYNSLSVMDVVKNIRVKTDFLVDDLQQTIATYFVSNSKDAKNT